MYESIAASLCRGPNQAPEVSAGPNHAVGAGQTVTVKGAAGDDGQPNGAALTYSWTLTSGPGSVTFATPNAAASDVTFPVAGTYVVRLTVSDGELSSYAEATYTAMAGGTEQFEAESSSTTLGGGATEGGGDQDHHDRAWGGERCVEWRGDRRHCPLGRLAAGDSVTSPRVAEQLAGVYQAIAWSLCRPENLAPYVSAGVERSVVLPAALEMRGVVADDGLPSGAALTVKWEKLSGPGTVSFSPVNSAVTTASFSAAGVYSLGLTAADGQKTAVSTVKVTAAPAGAAQTLTLEPQGMGPNLIGGSQALRARLKDSLGKAVVGAQVQFVVTGVNPATASAVTGADGVAEYVMQGPNRGIDTVLASSSGATAGGSVAWAQPAATLSTTAIRTRVYRSLTGGHFALAVGEQPLFERWFATVSFNPQVGWIANSSSGVSQKPADIHSAPHCKISELKNLILGVVPGV